MLLFFHCAYITLLLHFARGRLDDCDIVITRKDGVSEWLFVARPAVLLLGPLFVARPAVYPLTCTGYSLRCDHNSLHRHEQDAVFLSVQLSPQARTGCCLPLGCNLKCTFMYMYMLTSSVT